MNSRSHDPLAGLHFTTGLSALLDKAGVGIAAMDATGHLILFNSALEEMAGKSYEPVSCDELPRLFPHYNETGLRELSAGEFPLVRAWYGEHVTNAHIVVKRPDRPLRDLRINAIPLSSPDGTRRGAIALVEDITHAREGGTPFIELRDALITSLNHEIRTPLSTILGHAELLDDATADLPALFSKSVQAIQRAGRRLATVADDVITLASAQSAEDTTVNVRIIDSSTDDKDGPMYRPTRYTVYPTRWTEISDERRRDWRITVEDAGDGWAVRWRSRCLSYRYEWEFEPRPDSRTEEFLKSCRFSERAAINRARRAVDELLVDGMTFEEFVEHVRAEAAEQARAALAQGVSGSPAEPKNSRPILPLPQRVRRMRAHPRPESKG